jgi:hypothetical protein
VAVMTDMTRVMRRCHETDLDVPQAKKKIVLGLSLLDALQPSSPDVLCWCALNGAVCSCVGEPGERDNKAGPSPAALSLKVVAAGPRS